MPIPLLLTLFMSKSSDADETLPMVTAPPDDSSAAECDVTEGATSDNSDFEECSTSDQPVYGQPDDVLISLQERSQRNWGEPPVSSVPSLASDVQPYTEPTDMPLVANSKDNHFAKEISSYQNQLSKILQMTLQMPEHKEALKEKLGADFNPTTLVDGNVGDDDIKALKAFVEIFSPQTSLQTSWGKEGYSKAVIGQLGIVSKQVDAALAFDASQADAVATEHDAEVADEINDPGQCESAKAGVVTLPNGMTMKSDCVDIDNVLPELRDALPAVVDVWTKYSLEPVMTSANDSTRHEHFSALDNLEQRFGKQMDIHDETMVDAAQAAGISYHYEGRAVDIRGNNVSNSQAQRMAADLRSLLGNDYEVHYETFENAANNHFHIEYRGMDHHSEDLGFA
jgi:hypothetical protein